ncbi:sigma 54 modulation/S30EA ribosomal C-terminal domain-containing protein [Streptomyces novaecaesareae]|uniref:sigma 54 modulation/S30EA ribosomal C-terminal domain-containing protein n=1 Tax=Streptomyces novaecaesareae TaxID=68244 RepID=UPI000525F3B4|nr:sigma 54 modulation/S30EA ribosomal C-terminal domain-containing protein [Streptomyces novaecaesareae]
MGELVTVRAFEGLTGEDLAEARVRVAAAAAAPGVGTLVEALRVRFAAVADGVLAQANAEVDGRRIRVQEVAAGLGDSLDRVAEALRGRIRAVTGAWAPRPWPAHRAAAPGAAVPVGPVVPVVPVVPADPACSAVPGGPGDVPGGRVVRRKEPSLVWCSPEAAARTMDAMDYDIHLFTDPATETDAVVYRVGPTGYRLARTVAAGPPGRRTAPITLSPHGAPRLTEAQAVDRLEGAELPFLFFAHPVSGRGRVLYRRFDGRLGLIAGRA